MGRNDGRIQRTMGDEMSELPRKLLNGNIGDIFASAWTYRVDDYWITSQPPSITLGQSVYFMTMGEVGEIDSICSGWRYFRGRSIQRYA